MLKVQSLIHVMCIQDGFQKKSISLQDHQMHPNFHVHVLLLLFYWYKNPILHLFTFVFLHCNRWNPWFQVKIHNLLQEGKVGVWLSAYFLPLSLASAFLNLASFTQLETWSPGVPLLHIYGDCMSLPTPHSQGRSLIGKGQSLTPKPINCGQGFGY